MLLKDIADIKTGLLLDRKKAHLSDKNFHYKVISLKGFDESAVYDESLSENCTTFEKLKERYLVQKEDILVRLRGEICAVYISKNYENMIFNSLIARLRIKDKNFYPQFIAYFINSLAAKKALYKDIVGTRIALISLENLARLNVPSLSLEKQRQIIIYQKNALKEIALLKELLELKYKLHKGVFHSILQKEL